MIGDSAIGYSQRPVFGPFSAQFVICHLSFVIMVASRCAVRCLDRFAYDLAAMRYHTGLKDFVIEIQTEALGLFVPKVLYKGAEII